VAARSLADRPVRPRGLRLLLLAVVIAVAITAVGAAPTSATFPGPDGRIAFDALVKTTESFGIFTASPDGSDVRKLISIPDTLAGPDWSPDGQRIAFFTESFGEVHEPAQIHAINADGSGVTQLTTGPGFKGFPSWSPDADSLAFQTDWDDYPALQGIWIIPAFDPDGATQEEARRVTTLPAGFGVDFAPQFSPDGSSIAFARFKKSERKSAIHRVGIDGTGLERLTPWRLNTSHPDWSPDGQRIAFSSGEFGGSGRNIHVMRADGSGRIKLTNHPRVRKGEPGKVANNPVWSPSGTQIMYTRVVPRKCELVAMNPDGSGKHVVIGGQFGKRRCPNSVDWGTHF
jgi:Tol biopolymer transport system component